MTTHLRVATWNVLADAYVDARWFALSPPELLVRGARTTDVLKCALALDADVLGFQEAEPALYEAASRELIDYDVRWCPKGRSRPDGCLTAVRRTHRIVSEKHHLYDDASSPSSYETPSGHVAHILEIESAGHRITVANTHLRWFAPELDPATTPGYRQAKQLAAILAPLPRAVITADTNDRPGGPIRALLAEAGFSGVSDDAPTSIVNGVEPSALDVVGVRGARCVSLELPIPPCPPLPGPDCPSDHVPVVATVELS